MDLQTLGLKISRSENLTVLPNVVIQILRLFEDPNVAPRNLEKVIEQDAALTAKILRVASSSMYGVNSVNSVSRALGVLGMNTLRSIAISIGYQQMTATKSAGANFDRVSFWRHSLTVGLTAKQIMNWHFGV
jgi:HD-like signal output (HDOD) protein